MSFGRTSIAKQVKKRQKDDPDSIHPFFIRHNRALSYQFGAYEQEDDVRFRASKLPFCPILYAENLLVKQAGPGIQYAADWKGTFYTTIGTALHTLWQAVLTDSALEPDRRAKVRPFGSFICVKCGNTKNECFLPRKPCKCGGRWRYEELQVKYRTLQGHVDYLEYYSDQDQWVLSDLKTASLRGVDDPDQLAIPKNTFQIETYAVILEKTLGIKISYYCLWYQTRDNAAKFHPHFVKWTKSRRALATERLERWCDGEAAARKYVKRPTRENLMGVLDTRPCFSRADYKSEMEAEFKYEPGKRCPNVDVCTIRNEAAVCTRIHGRIQSAIEERKNGTGAPLEDHEALTKNKLGFSSTSAESDSNLFRKVFKRSPTRVEI